MSSLFGYLRPFVNEDSVQEQLGQLKSSGASKIYQEKPSRKKPGATQLKQLLSDLQAGDTLVVTSLSRIAHNTKHLLEILETLKTTGVTIRVLDCGIDTSTSQGEVITLLLGAIVDFERDIVRERQSAGIARAKKEGLYKGRKPTARAKADKVMALVEQGLTRQKIADELGIGVASVYRILKTNAEPAKKQRKVARKTRKPVEKQKQSAPVKPVEEMTEQLSFF